MLKLVSHKLHSLSSTHPLVPQFLLLQVLTIAAEIGGIISLSILKVKVSDIVDRTWMETNPKSRHLLQEQVSHWKSRTPTDVFSHSPTHTTSSSNAAV